MALTFIITGNDLCGTDTDRMAIIYTETVSEQRHATISRHILIQSASLFHHLYWASCPWSNP